MDISDIKPVEREIEITHPATEENIGIRVKLMALTDPRMKKIRRNIQDDKLRLDARGKHFKAEDVETNMNRMCFEAMLGWEWYNPTGEKGDKGFDENAMPTFDGEVPAFNQKNVFAICNRFEWFQDQISDAISDNKAFFTNSKAI